MTRELTVTVNPFGTEQLLAAIPGRRSPFLTYEPYYGLREKPFSLSADPRFLYKSPQHAATFDDLLDGIRRREGLIVLTGDIGTGKTTLCRAVLEHLDRKTFSTFVPDPFVSREDLLKMLLIDFGVMSVDDLKSGRLNGASRTDLTYPLYEFLNSLVPLLSFAVLIVDEAQNLSLPLLEELRILSDLEAPEKLLQVVMVGQLEFRSKLKLPEMRQFDQRVSVRCSLEALSRDGVAGYIAHRLNVAGGGSDRVEFTADAVNVIDRASAGVPRVINLICDRALHQGYLSRKARIDAETASSAIAHLGLGESIPSKARVFIPDEHDALAREMAAMFGPVPPPGNDAPTQPVAPRWPRLTRRLVAVAASLSVTAAAWTALSYVQRRFVEAPAIQAPPPARPPAAPFALSMPRGAMPSTAAPDTRPPEVPRTVSQAEEGPHVIDVALFESRKRSERSVEELTAAGYRARWAELDLGPDRHEYLVFVGGYSTRANAEPDLARIRAIPGYADAKAVAAPPPSTTR